MPLIPLEDSFIHRSGRTGYFGPAGPHLKMWTIFKVFIEFVAILLLFYVLVFLAARHGGS